MRYPGYTLVEMLIVVGLVSFLAAFMIPTYQLIITQLQLSTSADDVTSLLRTAEQKTVTEQVTYGMSLVAGATSIVQFNCSTASCDDGNGSSTKTTTSVFNFPANIQIDSVNLAGNIDLRFATSGAPNASGSVTLIDTSRGKRRTINVRPSGAIITSPAEF